MMDLRVVETGLVPVYETEGRQVVNARELHEFLGVLSFLKKAKYRRFGDDNIQRRRHAW